MLIESSEGRAHIAPFAVSSQAWSVCLSPVGRVSGGHKKLPWGHSGGIAIKVLSHPTDDDNDNDASRRYNAVDV